MVFILEKDCFGKKAYVFDYKVICCLNYISVFSSPVNSIYMSSCGVLKALFFCAKDCY